MGRTAKDTSIIIAGSGAYYATVIAIALCSIFGWRSWWAFNVWNSVPAGISIAVLTVLLLAPFLVVRDHFPDSPEAGSEERKLIWIAFIGMFCLAALFYLFRAETYFLGDGYGHLTLLAKNSPAYFRTHELGASLLYAGLKDLLGGQSRESALLVYQAVSIVFGVLFWIISCWFALRHFENRLYGALFAICLSAGGYLLLAFGYVENYNVFVLAVLSFCLVGIAVTREKANPLWLFALAAFATFMHILGVTLIPAAVYLYVATSPKLRLFKAMLYRYRTVWFVLLILTAASLFAYFYTTSFRFRLSIVPLWPDRFTVDGYYLWSTRHLTDLVNLLFVLLPSVGVLALVLPFAGRKGFTSSIESRFLLVTLVCTFGAAIIFNPRLGMPRDWDLFSFSAVPIAVFAFYHLFTHEVFRNAALPIGLLALLLSGSILSGRVLMLNRPDVAVDRLMQYVDLDPSKNRYVSELLFDYYNQRGDTAAIEAVNAKWRKDYPEIGILLQGYNLMNRGMYSAATVEFEKVLALNPIFPEAYGYLGQCQAARGNYDSALVLYRIAAGFSPYRVQTWSSMAQVYFDMRDYGRAEKLWLKAYALDSTHFETQLGLARLYKRQNQRDSSFYYLARVARRNDTPVKILVELGQMYLERQDYNNASLTFERALHKGLDSTVYERIRASYPQLSL